MYYKFKLKIYEKKAEFFFKYIIVFRVRVFFNFYMMYHLFYLVKKWNIWNRLSVNISQIFYQYLFSSCDNFLFTDHYMPLYQSSSLKTKTFVSSTSHTSKNIQYEFFHVYNVLMILSMLIIILVDLCVHKNINADKILNVICLKIFAWICYFLFFSFLVL